jgi:hypothetical protein
MLLMIAGLMNLVGLSSVATCLHSPVAWSPDGQWLAYSVEDPSPGTAPQTGWLFEQKTPVRTEIEGAGEGDAVAAPARRFRIWATDRTAASSVLIDESPWPLSAPGWAPDGHRLAYVRFLPHGASESRSTVTGRCELVVQEALDRKQVVLTLPDVELRPDSVDSFTATQPIWSPDGHALVVERPGPEPGILIVHPAEQRVQSTLLSALHASWSPEGTRLAVVVSPAGDHLDQRVQILGPDSTVLRTISGFGLISEPPIWSADGQSILVAGRRPQSRARALELIRIHTDSGFSTSVLPLVSVPMNQRGFQPYSPPGMVIPVASLPRVSLSLDRDQDQCAFAAEIPGHDPMIGFCNIRLPQTSKRFPAIDVSLRVGVLAMHPDGQLVAVRVEGLAKSGPVFLCELSSEEVTLLTPDPANRRDWLVTLAEAARGLLRTALPEASVDGRAVKRDSLLPVAGEIPAQSQVPSRLRRLGKIGQALLHRTSPAASAGAGTDWHGVQLDEYQLFFDCLAGDTHASEAVIDEMERTAPSSEMRLRLVAARAQVLHAQGHVERARAIVDYLLRVQRPETRVIEETAAGAVLAQAEDPARDWLLYLSRRLAKPLESTSPGPGGTGEEDENEIDLRLPGHLLGQQGLGFDGRLAPQARFGPGQAPRPRFGQPPGGRPSDPFIPGIPRQVMPPQPPRPFQPVTPTVPRVQRRDRPV